MENVPRNKRLSFAGLARCMEQIDDNGKHGRSGNWELRLGGYDHGYGIYFRGQEIGRVNYELKEYELYDEDFISKEQIPEFLAAIDARRFKDVGYHEQDDEFTDEDQDIVSEDGVKKRKLTGARDHITKDGMRGWTWDPKRDGYYITKNDFPEKFMDKFVPFLKGLRNEHCELDMWANSKNRLFIRWVGEKTKDKHWWHKLNINGSPANHEMASFARESLKEFVEEIEKFIGKSDLADVIQVNPNWRFWEDDCNDKSCNIGGKVGSINFLSELEPEQVKNFYDNMDTYAMLESRKVNESRKKIMWAINYRNMSTAIHGLYYGKDRKRVEAFADELEYIQNNDDWDWDEKQFAWENLMADFPDIQEIQEFNFRDIVDLPGGYEGIEDDDTIYRFVNKGSLDIYEEAGKKVIPAANGCSIHDMGDCYIVTNKNGLNIGQCRTLIEAEDIAENADERTRMKLGLESTRKGRMRKIVKEADEGYDSDTPKIYVGTYAKYNDGSLDGKWVDLTQYNTYQDFLDAMHELHSDEADPEFMVQDYENFPEKWYHEGGLPTEEEFNKINEYYMMDDERKEAYEAYVNYTGDDDFDNFQDAYQGHFDSPTDFAYDIVESLGWDGIGQENIDMYFDYDSFGRDLMYDFHIGDPDNTDSEGNPEDPDHYYDNDGYDEGEYESDTQVAEDYIENIGGVDQLGQETMQNYFDYDAYGRDLLINDYFEEDGYIFRRY